MVIRVNRLLSCNPLGDAKRNFFSFWEVFFEMILFKTPPNFLMSFFLMFSKFPLTKLTAHSQRSLRSSLEQFWRTIFCRDGLNS